MMKKKLKDICDFYSGTGFPTQYQGDIEGDYPFYKVSDIANNAIAGKVYLELCNNYISMDVAKKIKGCILPKDTVVFAKIGEALKLNRRAITSCNCLIDNNAMGIAPRLDSLSIMYFYFFMKNLNMQMFAESTTVPSVRKTVLEDYEIEVPTLNEQKKIERKLVLLQEIIERRKQELSALDYLTKARFVELFGNPIKNEKHWDIFKLGECLKSIDNGKSFTCNVRTRTDEHPAILKLSAVTYGDYRPEENKVLLDEKQFIDSAEVHSGDLLFTRKNTPELVGMAAYVHKTPAHLMMPDLIFRLVPNERMTAIFLWQLINNQEFRPVIQSIAGGSAKSMSNISKERLSNISVICPPIDEQIRLNEIIHKIDKSKILSETHIFYAEKSITPTTPKIFLKGRCIYGNEF